MVFTTFFLMAMKSLALSSFFGTVGGKVIHHDQKKTIDIAAYYLSMIHSKQIPPYS